MPGAHMGRRRAGAMATQHPSISHTSTGSGVDPATARQRLAHARALVVGVGGLGCPAALALAAAGVGTLGLVDGDRVDLSNLQRQILHRVATLGMPKTASAAATLHVLHPALAIETFDGRWPAGTPGDLLGRFDVVVDGSDRAATKLALNDACVAAGVPYVYAGAVGWDGQWMAVVPGRTACLRCLFGDSDGGHEPTCGEIGVLAPVVGLIGFQQAMETIKLITGVGTASVDRLTTYDGLRQRFYTVRVDRNPRCPTCGGAHRVP
jgi:molybdopterin/thiamine biosynthesis adenylyltransferase